MDFGGESEKAVYIYSNNKKLAKALQKKKDPNIVFTKKDIVKKLPDKGNKTGRVCGGKGLKGTERYPDRFGEGMFCEWSKHKDNVARDVDAESISDEDFHELQERWGWSEAKLDDLAQSFKLPEHAFA